MSIRFKSLYPVLCLVAATQLANAADDTSARKVMRPSDCKPRDADSTCATAVAGATVPTPIPDRPGGIVYDGPLGGVPPFGYSYWGFDFIADQTGTTSPIRQDEFINRSTVPVTIKLSFNFPTNHLCNRDCLPGVEFELDAGWFKVDPPYVIQGNVVSVSHEILPGHGYGWVIGLWQSINPRLTVSIPIGAKASMEQLGLPSLPAVSQIIPATTHLCECYDGTTASCSDGSHFSNGLIGTWTRNFGTYPRDGSFNNCPPER